MIAYCPHCDNEFYVPVDLGGKTVKCSKCKKKVQAPEAPDVSSVAVGSVSIQGTASLSGGAGGILKNRPKTGGGVGLKEPAVSSGSSAGGSYLRGGSTKRGASGGPGEAFRKSLKRRVNIQRGINRLVFVLSVGALLPGVPELTRYLLDRSVWRMKDMIGFFLPWPAVGFASLWAVYGIGLCIAKGFSKRSGHSRRSGLRRLTFVISILPFAPGIYQATKDYLNKPDFQLKEVLDYFIYWPVAAFAGIWVAYIAGSFVFRGFYDPGAEKKSKSRTTVRRSGAKQPSESQVSRTGNWRTT